MPDLIIFNCIVTNSMYKNAGVIVGENDASGWDSDNKNQNSIGNVAGAGNFFTANLNLMNDIDILDTPIIDNDIEISSSAKA